MDVARWSPFGANRGERVNPFKPIFNIVIFIHHKPRIAAAIPDL